MYIPRWLLTILALALFFLILYLVDRYDRQKQELETRIKHLEAELGEKQKPQQSHIWPEDTWLDPKIYPPEE
jgi:hypothetical protein